MEIIGKLSSNDKSNIGMIPRESNYVFIKSADQCIHNINIKDGLNGLKGNKKKDKNKISFQIPITFSQRSKQQ